MAFKANWAGRRAALTTARIVVALSVIFCLRANAAGFIEAPPLGHARASHSATMLQDGELLIAGGVGGGEILASSEIYDQILDSWRPGASLNVARYGHTATLLPSGLVLATGGWGGGIVTATTEIYDWLGDAWSPASPMSVKRINHTATLLQSGKVLVCGGQNDQDFALTSCETYDPLLYVWLPAAAMLAPRSSHTATMLPSGKILFAGGYNGLFLASAEIYDPVNDTFSPAAPMIVPRYSHTATLLRSGWVLVVGGANTAGATADVEIYDPVMDAWRTVQSLPVPRTLHAAAMLAPGDVLIAGGGFVNTALTDAEIFDVIDETWRSAGDLFEGRFSSTATPLSNDSVLVVGGRTASAELASVERFLREGHETFSMIETAPAPSVVGEPYLVTVTVDAFASDDVPTGSVVVSDNRGASCGPVVLVSGSAACELTAYTDGEVQVSADYTPADARFDPNNTIAQHTVTEADTHLAIVGHTPEPSLPTDDVTVTIEFGVTPPGAGSPHGAIWIGDGSGSECVIPEGESSCAIHLSIRGPRTLTATYGGDGDFNPSSATATHHVNRLPIALADGYAWFEDTTLTVSESEGVLVNDTDEDGDALTLLNPGVQPAGGIGGTVVLAADGGYTYTPPADANGEATFEYTVSDGLETATAEVTISVAPVNDPPVFTLSKYAPLPPGTSGDQTIANVATIVSMGAPDESGQSVLAWQVRIIADPQGLLMAVPYITSDGALHFSASGRDGSALIGIALQDDGGTENGGQDTSAESSYFIEIDSSTDLAIRIDNGVSFLADGDQPLYVIVVSNVGFDASAGATVDVQRSSLNFTDESWTCTPDPNATCTPSGSGDIHDDVSLPPGATVVYELTGTVHAIPEIPVQLNATVLVWLDPPDVNPLNNTATDIDVTGIFADGFDAPDDVADGMTEAVAAETPATEARKQ